MPGSGRDALPPDHALRDVIVAGVALASRLGGRSAWSRDHVAQYVSVTLPGARPALAALAAVPVVGPILAAAVAAVGADRTVISLSPAVWSDPLRLLERCGTSSATPADRRGACRGASRTSWAPRRGPRGGALLRRGDGRRRRLPGRVERLRHRAGPESLRGYGLDDDAMALASGILASPRPPSTQATTSGVVADPRRPSSPWGGRREPARRAGPRGHRAPPGPRHPPGPARGAAPSAGDPPGIVILHTTPTPPTPRPAPSCASSARVWLQAPANPSCRGPWPRPPAPRCAGGEAARLGAGVLSSTWGPERPGLQGLDCARDRGPRAALLAPARPRSSPRWRRTAAPCSRCPRTTARLAPPAVGGAPRPHVAGAVAPAAGLPAPGSKGAPPTTIRGSRARWTMQAEQWGRWVRQGAVRA